MRAGDIVFVGGQMSLDADGRAVGADVTTQARNVFEALKRTLGEAGATMADVVKHTVFFVCEATTRRSRRFLDELDAVRTQYFTAPGPTTAEVRCGLDVEGALLMVDAWAVVGGTREVLSPPGHFGRQEAGAVLARHQGRRHDLRRRPAPARPRGQRPRHRRHRDPDRRGLPQPQHHARGGRRRQHQPDAAEHLFPLLRRGAATSPGSGRR